MNRGDNSGLQGLRDDPGILHQIGNENKHPINIVILRCASEIKSRLILFIIAFSCVQVILWMLWGVPAQNIPLFNSYKLLLPLFSVFISISLVVAQLLLLHESAHHSVFKTSTNRTASQFILVAVAATIVINPLYYFIPSGNTTLPLNLPYLTIYQAVSGFVLVLITPYISRILWDYFRPTTSQARKACVAFIGVVLLSFGVTVVSSILAGIYNPTLTVIGRMTLISGFVSASAVVGMYQGLSTQRSNQNSERHTNTRLQKSSIILSRFRNSNLVSILCGSLAGLSLPVLAGVSYMISQDADFAYLIVGEILIFGYLSIMIFAVFSVLSLVILSAILHTVSFSVSKFSH